MEAPPKVKVDFGKAKKLNETLDASAKKLAGLQISEGHSSTRTNAKRNKLRSSASKMEQVEEKTEETYIQPPPEELAKIREQLETKLKERALVEERAAIMAKQKNLIECAIERKKELVEGKMELERLRNILRMYRPETNSQTQRVVNLAEDYYTFYNSKFTELESVMHQVDSFKKERERLDSELKHFLSDSNKKRSAEEFTKRLLNYGKLESLLRSANIDPSTIPGFPFSAGGEKGVEAQSAENSTTTPDKVCTATPDTEEEAAATSGTSAVSDRPVHKAERVMCGDMDDSDDEDKNGPGGKGLTLAEENVCKKLRAGPHVILQCEICKIIFSKKKRFRKHMVSVHNYKL